MADYFYRGPLAREISNWSAASGGLIRYGDLARHVTRVEEPVAVTYRGYLGAQVRTLDAGPVLAGGVAVAGRIRPQGDGTQFAGRDSRDG